MATFRQRRDPARLFLRRLGIALLLVGVFVAASSVWRVYRKEHESALLRAHAESERTDLLEREARLNEDIEQLMTDRGMEKALREQYSLAEEGEGLIVIVEPSAPEAAQATSTWAGWMHKLLPFW
jgi:cell division protein FtsB